MAEFSQKERTGSYREEQRLNQPWVKVLMGGVAVAAWAGVGLQLSLTGSFGNNLTTWSMIAIGVIAGGVLPLWVLSVRLVVEVRPERLVYKYVGLHRSWHEISWDEVAHFYGRRYKPIREYGGWGIRFNKEGKAYNAKGEHGVQLVMRDGGKVLFGSQEPERLVAAIEDATGRKASKPDD
jgi:hypothetical protein